MAARAKILRYCIVISTNDMYLLQNVLVTYNMLFWRLRARAPTVSVEESQRTKALTLGVEKGEMNDRTLKKNVQSA